MSIFIEFSPNKLKLNYTSTEMAKEVKEIKDFLKKAHRRDARIVKIQENSLNTRFKVRCSRFLYTLVVADQEMARKLKQSLPSSIEIQETK